MNQSRFFFILASVIWLSACVSTDTRPESEASEVIGSASMDADRMITVMLRAEDGHGMAGDAAFFMNTDHKDYDETIQHVGGLKPGQSKPYPAWPKP
ncbi:MAG: hypothetical protein IPK32_01985 [Verrucomicrobiaceae bacterium]|nr:hypothetical protein [Verrucomicrobiaceae bacterium]